MTAQYIISDPHTTMEDIEHIADHQNINNLDIEIHIFLYQSSLISNIQSLFFFCTADINKTEVAVTCLGWTVDWYDILEDRQ